MGVNNSTSAVIALSSLLQQPRDTEEAIAARVYKIMIAMVIKEEDLWEQQCLQGEHFAWPLPDEASILKFVARLESLLLLLLLALLFPVAKVNEPELSARNVAVEFWPLGRGGGQVHQARLRSRAAMAVRTTAVTINTSLTRFIMQISRAGPTMSDQTSV